MAAPRSSEHGEVHRLQRSIGNRATRDLLATLPIGREGDAHERQAERIASGGSFEGEPTRATTAPLRPYLGSGSPLPTLLRAQLEEQIGSDLGSVRVHTSPAANAQASALGATAFTVGEDIVFARGRYDPSSLEGRRVLAHEVAHVRQQRQAPLQVQRLPEPADAQGRTSGVVKPPRGSSIDAIVRRATAPGVALGRVGFAVTIAAGQRIPVEGGDVLHTDDATQLTASIDRERLSISFAPGLLVEHGLDSKVATIEDVEYEFKAGTLELKYKARNYARWFGNPGSQLLDGLSKLLLQYLPPQALGKNYDPFADPDLLTGIAERAAGATGTAPHVATSNARATALIGVGQELRYPVDGLTLVVYPRSMITITAELDGGIPETAKALRVAAVSVDIWDQPVQGRWGRGAHVYAGDTHALHVASVRGAKFIRGGGLELDYQLLGTGTQERRSTGGLLDRDVRLPAMRAIRDLVLANRHALPEVDLADVLGYRAP
jgi:hypothetical protein